MTTGERTLPHPGAGGTAHARYLMRKIAQTPRAEAGGPRRPRRGCSSSCAARRAAAGWSRSSRTFWTRRRAHGRRQRPGSGRCARWAGATSCSPSRSLDPRELELPAAGLMTFVDPETGDQLEVQTSTPGPAGALRRGGGRRSARQIATTLRHAGAAHLQLRTDRDWLTDVVRFVRRPSAAALVAQWGALMDFLSPAWLLLLIAVGRRRCGVRRAAAAPEEVRRPVQQRVAAGVRRAAPPRLAAASHVRAAARRD